MNGSQANLMQARALPADAGAAGAAPGGWRAWLQVGPSQGFEWNRLEIAVQHLLSSLAGLRIVHLTDLHFRPRWLGVYDELIGRLRRDPPDLIVCTGDLVDHPMDHRPALPTLERFITQLVSRLGIYAVTGNHDGDLLGPRLAGWGVHFINRRYVRLEDGQARLELIGLPGVKRHSFDPEFVTQIPQRSPGVPRIVLGHFPDQVRHIAGLKADVMLAGHTHGGQICLPGGYPLLTHDTLPKSMARGAHRVGETLLVVNRGFGTARWAIRLFCPAEIIELRLVTA